MKKILFVFAFFVSLFVPFASAFPVFAITKTSGDLELTANEPLFSPSTVWRPGLEETRSFVVKNIGSEAHTLYVEAVNSSQTGNVANVLLVKFSSGVDLYGGGSSKTMTDFFADGQISLVDISGSQTTTIEMTVAMLTSAGNQYQGQEAKFDLEIGFVGEEEAAVVISGVSAPGLPGPPVCHDTPPTGPPVLLSAVRGINSVSLSWIEAPNPISYYLVAYGTTSGNYLYGNPNIGSKGTTSYTVSGLSGGTIYYFIVRAGNGCAPGRFSNELSAVPFGAFLAGPAVGFLPGVMGEATPSAGREGELAGGGTTGAGEIAGVKAKSVYRWWLIIVLILIFLAGYLYWKRR